MSERVLPDRYGYWIAKTVRGNQVVFRVFGGNGISAVYTDLRGDIHPVEKFSGEWIASVADIQDRLATAEDELAELKQRIAAATVAWAVMAGSSNRLLAVDLSRMTADEEAESWYDDNDPTSVMRVRLLEVRDVE